MTELHINGKKADLGEKLTLALSLTAEALRHPEEVKEVRYVIELPATLNNRKMFGFSEQLNSAVRFNDAYMEARVTEAGCLLFLGEAVVKRCVLHPSGTGMYVIELIRRRPAWAEEMSRTLLREIEYVYERTVTEELVRSSWTDNSPVKFLPVHRDQYGPADYANEIPPVKILAFEDYHPFFQVRFLVERMFSRCGYTVESTFMESDYFTGLYVSGNYPEREIDAVKARMNFLAGKINDRTAVADSYGAVYLSAEEAPYHAGCVADTADPFYLEKGRRIEGAFDNGACIVGGSDGIRFVPNDDVTVGFEYRLRFCTDFTLVSDTECRGFDRIFLDDGQFHRFDYYPAIEDHKYGTGKTGNFTVFVPGFEEGENYRLVKYYADDDVEEVAVTARTFPTDLVKATVGFILLKGQTEQVVDWKLFVTDEFTAATRNVEIDITLRSQPRFRKNGEAVYFSGIYLLGAEPGTSFTLMRGTTVRPVFYSHPLLGAEITLDEVLAHDRYQIDFIRGLAHLFNLRFYTDEVTRTVHIEPAGEFYREEPAVDWTDRIYGELPLEVGDPGEGRNQIEIYSYNENDGTVSRFNRTYQMKYAEWETTLDSRLAKDAPAAFVNPFFSSSMDVGGIVPQSWSATWIAAGDREDIGYNYDDGNLNFPPKIVRYAGMEALEANEYWSWPYDPERYPRLAFHPDSPGSTLCFDDYEGAEGLNAFYRPTYQHLNRGRLFRLHLKIHPYEMESLLFPHGAGPDFRSLYRFVIGGETVYARLEAIEDYRTEDSGIVSCTFLKTN